MAIPVLAWVGASILGGGLFLGSQIDDRIERPNYASSEVPNTGAAPEQSLFSFTNITKIGLLAGASYLVITALDKADLV